MTLYLFNVLQDTSKGGKSSPVPKKPGSGKGSRTGTPNAKSPKPKSPKPAAKPDKKPAKGTHIPCLF